MTLSYEPLNEVTAFRLTSVKMVKKIGYIESMVWTNGSINIAAMIWSSNSTTPSDIVHESGYVV